MFIDYFLRNVYLYVLAIGISYMLLTKFSNDMHANCLLLGEHVDNNNKITDDDNNKKLNEFNKHRNDMKCNENTTLMKA